MLVWGHWADHALQDKGFDDIVTAIFDVGELLLNDVPHEVSGLKFKDQTGRFRV